MQDESQKRHAKQLRQRYCELDSEFANSQLRLDIVHSQVTQIMMTEAVRKGEIPSGYSFEKFSSDLENILSQEEGKAVPSQPSEGVFAKKRKDEAQIIREILGNVFGLNPGESKSMLPYWKVEEDGGINIFDKNGPLKFGVVLNHEDKYDGLAGILKIFSKGKMADPITKSQNIFKVITMDYYKFTTMTTPAITCKILYSMIADDLFRRLFRWSRHVKLDRPALLETRQKNAGTCKFSPEHKPSIKILRDNFPYFQNAEKFSDWSLEVLSRYMVMQGKGRSATLLEKGAAERESDSSIFLVLLGQIDVKLGEDRTYAIKKGDVVGEYSFLTRYPRSYDVLHKNANFLAAELHSAFINCPGNFKIDYEINKAYQLVSRIFEIIITSLIQKIALNNEYVRKKEKMDQLKKIKL